MITKNVFYEIEPAAFKSTKFPNITADQTASLIKYCRVNELSAKCGPKIYVQCNKNVEVFNEECLVFTISAEGQSQFTEYYRKYNGGKCDNSMADSLKELALKLLWMAYQIHSRSISDIKRVRGFCTLHSIASWRTEVKEYSGGTDFEVAEKNGAFSILCNGTVKKVYKIPDGMYSMPNKGEITLLYSKNAKTLDDGGEINRVLSEYVPELGRCYTNADVAYTLLKAAGYTNRHDVQYFCGWLFSEQTHQGVHHAWLVVDGKSVIDPTLERDNYIEEVKERAQQGEYLELTREILAQKIKESKKVPRPFIKRCFYGRPTGWLYIGVPANPAEGVQAYSALMSKYPGHPSYQNLSKNTGVNRLNEIYYGLAQ